MKRTLILLCLIAALSSCQHKESKIADALSNKQQENTQATDPSFRNDFKKPVYNKEVKHSPDDVALVDDSVTPYSKGSTGHVTTYAFAAASTACSAPSENPNDGSPPPPATYQVSFASMGSPPASSPANTITQTRGTKIPSEIIKNATINFNVSSADSSHIRIRQSISELSAYLNLDKRMQTPEGIVYKLQIRVSPENFDKLVDAIMKESIYTESEDISADDVTAQFVDMEARLKSKQEVEKRYADLLSRAQKVNDILVIESNRRQIQEEIESIEGNLRLLRDQVAYSTIYLTITQKIKEEPKPAEPEKPGMTFIEQVRAALGAGWMGIRYTAVFLLTIWPLIPIVIVALIVTGLQAKRKKSTQEEDSGNDEEEIVENK